MLIDEVLPSYDATRVEHATVAAEPATLYTALLDADLMEAYRGSPSMRALFALRTAPAAIARWLRREPAPPPAASMRLRDLPEEGEWVKLGEAPGVELVFGAIGRFWGREIEWRRIRGEEFPGFDRPGYGKIAAGLSVREFGAGRSLLSYEARTTATDERSRRRFGLYWRAVSPGVGLVMRALFAHIRSIAESRPAE